MVSYSTVSRISPFLSIASALNRSNRKPAFPLYVFLVHANCDDLAMRYAGAFSAEMQDMLGEEGRANLLLFAEDFFKAIEELRPASRRYAAVVHRAMDYAPGATPQPIDAGDQKVVVVTDATPDQASLMRMVECFQNAFAQVWRLQ